MTYELFYLLKHKKDLTVLILYFPVYMFLSEDSKNFFIRMNLYTFAC